MDIPWYIWLVAFLILSPWIIGGAITVAVFLFGVLAGLLVVVFKIIEPFERRYRRTEFAKRRRQAKIDKRRRAR